MKQLTRRKAILSSIGVGAAALAGCVSAADDPSGGNENSDDGEDAGAGSDPEATLEQLGSECGGPDSESVSVFDDDSAYVVTGTLPSPSPCYEPVLEATDYEEGTLSLTVDAVEEDPDRDCLDCPGALDYEVTVGELDAEPTSVEVTHVTGETHTVEAGAFTEGRPASPELIDAEITMNSGNTRGESFGGSDIELGDVTDLQDAETGSIRIHGTIPTSTPHYRAVLDDVAVSGSELQLAVSVESTLGEDEMGTQTLGVVSYTAVVELRNPGLIGSVKVDHPDSGHGMAWESASASAGGGVDPGDGDAETREDSNERE